MMQTRHTDTSCGDAPRADAEVVPVAPWNGSAILLVDLDAFFASVEQLDHPGWRGKPVIVGGDPDRHGVVSTASYEARVYGVHSAMPSSTARRLCPDAIWTRGRFDRYRVMSNKIMDILRDESPFMQQVSIDEAFLDVTPNGVNTEHPVLIARRIQRRVSELGVTCSIGVGTSKTVAKIASDRDKPRGLTVVYPGRERDFLAPLPVRALSGVGASTERELASHGIRTLGDLARADRSYLIKAFGKNGEIMHLRANGGDDSPVETDDEVKSVSNEVTFSTDLETREDIEAALETITAKVARRLRGKGLRGKTVAVKLKTSDRGVTSAQRQLPEPTDDEFVIMPYVSRLIDEVWRSGIKVRLLGVAVTGFDAEASDQLALFDAADAAPAASDVRPKIADEAKRQGLISVTDAVKDRFGEGAVRFGRELRQAGNTTGSASKNPADYK